MIPPKDREILRELGCRTAEIAALPVQKEKIKLWKALNGLKPVRPMVMIDQIPWHELEPNDELKLQTEDEFCRELETRLRRKLYSWEHMRADMVIEPFIDIPKIIRGADFGIKPLENLSEPAGEGGVRGHEYIDQLKTKEDLEKIRMPELMPDTKATAKLEEKTREIFDGILDVRMRGLNPSFALWDRIVEWHGVESSIIDLLDRPEFIHKIAARATEASLSLLSQAEEKGLLDFVQQTVHCSGAYTDELPADGFNPEKPRAKDIWTLGMAQIFSTVSPAMHKEFEIDYAVKWYERFGLVYYGCCEPLHMKIDIIRDIPNLRKISMSPWADAKIGAEKIGPDFVFSSKPNPALLAVNSWNPSAVKSEISGIMKACEGHRCPVEFILKDISTVKGRPERLSEWEDIAMEAVGAEERQQKGKRIHKQKKPGKGRHSA